MKTKHLIFYTFFLALTNCKNDTPNIPESIKTLVEHSKELEAKSENQTLKNISVYDYFNKEMNLLDKIDTEKIIFFYNDYIHCNTCVEKTFELIEKNKSVNKKDIIVLIKFSSQFEFSTFKRINNLKGYEVYSLKKETIGLPVEKIDFPFFFVLNKNGLTENYHAVIKELPELTNSYLNDLNI